MEEQSSPVAHPPATEAPVAQPTVVADDGEPKSYLAMMLLAFFTAPMGFARVYRGERSGWVRFWIYVASYILSFVGIGVIGILAVTIWGIVDFFLLKKTSTDLTGRPLHTTVRDTKVVDVLFRIMIIVIALLGVGLVITVLMFGFVLTTFQHGFTNHDYQNQPTYSHPVYN